jgi:hypothetical protein
MNLSDLKVGQFAERNKNILYRVKPKNSVEWPNWLSGTYHVYKHPEIPLWKDPPPSEGVIHWGGINDEVTFVANPERKYVNNTIKMLKDDLKDNKIDNLTYIENLNILRNYLKSDIVKAE